MKRKHINFFIIFFFTSVFAFSQNGDEIRIQKLEKTLDSLTTTIPSLSNKVDLSINATELPTFLRAIASSNTLNLSIDTSLKSITITQSFSDATVKNVLLYVCKQHSLTLDILGNIISIKRYIRPYLTREIFVNYNANKNLFSTDIQNDSLAIAFKKITKVTNKNLIFGIGLGGKKISAFIKDMPFDAAIEKIAFINNLQVTKTKDNFYLFENNINSSSVSRRIRTSRNGNFFYQIKDTLAQTLKVDFTDIPVENIINDISYDLKINMATSSPLKNMGKATIKSDNIIFQDLVSKLLEDTKFGVKVKDGMFVFGKRGLNSVKNTVIIPLMSRSIQMMMEPMQSGQNNNYNDLNNNQFSQNGNFNNGFNQNVNQRNRQNLQTRSREPFSTDYDSKGEALLSIVPKEVTDSLSISTDVEQNSFIVSGDALKIEKFKKFLKEIDKPVPVVLIEVMIIEVNKSASVSAGIDLGIGENPTTDQGTIFSGTDLTLGAKSINKIIGGFNGFGSLNIGKVVPNFYARIQALETNGDLKVKSTPKLSTLNGHVATLSNGQRSYYAVRQTNTIGSQNPSTIETVNYVPTDANLSINIRPLVSGDNNITLSINVLQSNFNGDRIADDAPPGINSREFTSTIRVKDQDVIILGGLEENLKNDSGSGVPFLARVPIIKWLFSKRTRTASQSKLSVLIKPTIIQ